MAKKNHIPEVDIVVDEKAGVIREVERKFISAPRRVMSAA